MSSSGLTVQQTGWKTSVLLGLALITASIFVISFAGPYFTLDQQRFGVYWVKRGWLLLHILGGIIAISVGPFVLWLGLRRRRMNVHRALGFTYMSSVAVSSIAAFYLSFHTDFGWVFGAGMSALAIAWIVTTSMAFISIRKRLVSQHREWMIRSYVVTFAFVNFRIFFGILQIAGVGTLLEQLGAASWFCWSVPLLITEVVIQGQKISAGKVMN